MARFFRENWIGILALTVVAGLLVDLLWYFGLPWLPQPPAPHSSFVGQVEVAWERIQVDPENPVNQRALRSALRNAAIEDTARETTEQKDFLQQARVFDEGISHGTVAVWDAILAQRPKEPLRHLALQQRELIIAQQEKVNPPCPSNKSNNATSGDNSPIISGNCDSTIVFGGAK